MTATDELERLRGRGELVWENERYGAVYAIDHGHVAEMLGAGLILVLHAGQAEAVEPSRQRFPARKSLG